MLKNTLFLFAYPNIKDSISNRKIKENIALLEGVKIRSLYDLYPHGHIDVNVEQNLLIKADLVIFQFPMFWFSAPSILKIWQDHVLTSGFAFGTQEKDFKLKGKSLLLSFTTGGNREKYHAGNAYNYTFDELLRPFQMMAYFCKMIYSGYIQSNGRPIGNKKLDSEISKHITKLSTFIKKKQKL